MTRELVDSTFLTFLQTALRTVGLTVEREAKIYAKLLALGWSDEQLLDAIKVGYPLWKHADVDHPTWGGPQYLDAWLRDHYNEQRAASVDLTLEQFTAVWLKLFFPRLIPGVSPVRSMQLYMKCRHAGLDHAESHAAALSWEEEVAAYIAMRRKGIDAALARRFMNCPREKLGYVNRAGEVKSIAEALRRGATPDQVVSALYRHRIHQLALDLRKEDRASEQGA